MARAKTVRRKASVPRKRVAANKTTAVTFDVVRAIAHRLPDVEDSTSYGTAALKVRGKLFARQHQQEDALVLRMELLDRHILMQADPNAFFITEHYRNYPWILVRFSAIDRDALPDLLQRAWRLVAPKKLVIEYDAGAQSMVRSRRK